LPIEGVSKKRTVIQTFFSATTYTAIPYFGILFWQAVYSENVEKP
jgi:hypothetical protein